MILRSFQQWRTFAKEASTLPITLFKVFCGIYVTRNHICDIAYVYFLFSLLAQRISYIISKNVDLMFYFIVASLDCFKAPGASMLPTMGVSGDIVLVGLISPRFGKTVPGDIVIVRSPECPRKVITKRLIAQAGDSVTFLVDPKNSEQSKTVVVPKGHVWIQGDNINDSRDSRAFGPVPYGLLYGKVFWRVSEKNDFSSPL
ncbi:hypothetical protein KSS87_017374 [Heliosperma pusillum]|nr:hypothetical protein KSS87_017374 [Heliosperma pusillum]